MDREQELLHEIQKTALAAKLAEIKGDKAEEARLAKITKSFMLELFPLMDDQDHVAKGRILIARLDERIAELEG